uniref:SUN domain-containing protein n=1 Tax=Lactuca sativa TaxID=4236 RepID=A0A9R1W1I9_LACSA|nr:hypothetical protein LSAT_V11C400198020 [Lactuca sativa]
MEKTLISWDRLERDEVREIIEKEIAKHAADGIGRVNYAVASCGGRVLKHSEPSVLSSRLSRWISGNVHRDATGECFPLKGDNGFVEVKLCTSVVPEAITVEHVSKSVALDRSNAPKGCKVLGWLGDGERKEKMHLLTRFRYDLKKSNVQTFNVVDPTVVDTIRLEFMSNHGNPNFTCIYRVRVHGHESYVA